MAGLDDEIPPPPQTQTPSQQARHTVSAIKLLILKKEEYDIWAMKMEHYLAHTDYPIWEVIQRGNGPVSVPTDINGVIKVLPPKTAEEILARERERKSRTTLLMALPEYHLAKFHKMTNAKEMWEAIKSRFGGNDESKKMQKKAFVSENTSSTNEVSTTYGASSSSGHNPQREGSFSYTDELMYSFFANQSSGPQLDYEDLEQLDEFDLDEIDLKWQVNQLALIRLKSSATIVIRQGILLENADLRGIKIVGGEMLDTLGTKLKTVKEDLENKRNLKLWEQLGDASIEIQAYTQALKKVEAQLVAHQQNQLWFEEKIRFMKIDLDDKTDMRARDKAGLGYGNQINKGVLSYENEVFESVFYSRSSDIEDSLVNDRYAEGMHAVPSPRIYIPYGPDVEIDDKETLTSIPKPVVNEPKVVSQPKVWSDAPIIEEYESDSDDEHVSLPTKEQETPNFAFVNTVKHVKTPRQTVKVQNTCSQNPKPDRKDCSGLMSKKLGLGYGFTKKACFVCGSFSHLIRDCDFHEKRMAKQAELNKRMCKGTGKRENKPYLTRTGRIPVNTARAWSTNNVNTARHNFNSQAAPTNDARKVNTVKHIVNNLRPKTIFHKTQSPIRRPFYRTTEPRTKFSNQNVNTAEVKAVKLKNVSVPLDYFPINTLTSKVLSFMVKKGKNFSGNVTPLFDSMLVQPTEDGGEASERPSQSQPIPSPSHPSEDQPKSQPGPSPKPSPSIPIPDSNLFCLIAKATIDESNKWHRRLGHVNFKNLNKLVKGNLVRGLPSKIFQNDHTCVACQKGKQHKASCKAKSVSSISQTLQLLHMDLFGPTSVRSLNHKTYFLVITDDFSRFSWVFFLRTKDETSGILKDFIRQIENQLNQKVKTIRCDNGTEFKNRDFIEFCGSKGIKREYSNARTPQQNGVAERKNMTLIVATRTMLADSFLRNTFWAEAVCTACYVLNRVLVTKPHNKTPYELITDDPKDKARNFLEEAESEIARKVQEEWETEDEKKKLAEAEATKAALIRDYDDIHARIEADSILAARLREEEREKLTIEERAKLLHDTIAAQRRFLAKQELMLEDRNHSDLKTKNFEEIQVLYKRIQDELPEGFDRKTIYPLRKKVLVQMLELKLESEEDNTMALELIRFVKKLIAELEPENSDGNEKDL
ncbi:putative ribonuclease H-like domain-containing protein [Tanacetum coccineum]